MPYEVLVDSKIGRLIKLINYAWVVGTLFIVFLMFMAWRGSDYDDFYSPTYAIMFIALSQLPRAVNYVMVGKAVLFWGNHKKEKGASTRKKGMTIY